MGDKKELNNELISSWEEGRNLHKQIANALTNSNIPSGLPAVFGLQRFIFLTLNQSTEDVSAHDFVHLCLDLAANEAARVLEDNLKESKPKTLEELFKALGYSIVELNPEKDDDAVH